MKGKAKKDNKTLRITKDKEYNMCTVGVGGSLVLVDNDAGDEVVMHISNFDKS